MSIFNTQHTDFDVWWLPQAGLSYVTAPSLKVPSGHYSGSESSRHFHGEKAVGGSPVSIPAVTLGS